MCRQLGWQPNDSRNIAGQPVRSGRIAGHTPSAGAESWSVSLNRFKPCTYFPSLNTRKIRTIRTACNATPVPGRNQRLQRQETTGMQPRLATALHG